MKKEIKELWIKALNSGKFKQTRGLLKDVKGYCCLGVLCELYLDKHSKTTWKDLDNSRDETESGDVLPVEVREWAGLWSDNPRVIVGKEEAKLSECNDGSVSEDVSERRIKPKTFKQIAKIIEKQL